MIFRIRNFIKKTPWLPFALAGVGALLYLWQTWHFVHTLGAASLDESMYIYKGYLFASGKYVPYQDYGPLTNHMPLAFMIPGYIQLWFGPGMAAARIFAFLTGALMLAGVWLAFYRLGGAWWAAGVVWLFALNPSWQEIFSLGLTQGLVNAFLAWSFVFLLGEERKTWQLALAAGLAALAVMTRINTVPILGLMVLYVFWQHGWKKGLYTALAAALVGGIVLAAYWPGVLKFISGWVPEGLFGFIEPYRSPWSQQHVPDGFSYLPIRDWLGDHSSLQWNGVAALYESFNFNFVPYLAVLGALVFWPKKSAWPNQYRFRLSVFLAAGWLVMAGMHMWVALSGTSCPFFCLSGYFVFFNLLALLLVPASLPYWQKKPAVWRQVVGLALLFGIVDGALFDAGFRYRRISGFWRGVLNIQIPRMKNGRIIQGETGPLRVLLESKLGVTHKYLTNVVPVYLYWIFVILLVFGLTGLLYRILKKQSALKASFGNFALLAFMSAALMLSPTQVFYKETANARCQADAIASHEIVGAELAAMLPEEAQVYWSVTSNILLLYLPDVEVFPPQLNTSFNFVENATPEESDEIYRFGYWDEYLRADWLEQAGYLVVPGERYNRFEDIIVPSQYERVGTTSPYNTCQPGKTQIYVFRQIDKD